jgi:hypothetical protein
LGNAPEMKPCTSAFVIILLIGGLALAGTLHLDTVRAATNVSGIISSNATWTKANSPYSLTGNVLVSNGVTLTIEAGATVNLNSYFIMVNGTLRARGSNAEPIGFNVGSISVTEFSSECVIDNTDFESTSISSGVSLKITNSIIDGSLSAAGSSEVTNNQINNQLNVGGSSIVTNNNVKNGLSASGSCRVQNNVVVGAVSVSDNCTFSGNTVTGSVASRGSSSVTSNTISGDVSVSDSPEISHNTIAGSVTVDGQSPIISFNSIGNGVIVSDGSPRILNNTIKSNDIGVDLSPNGYATLKVTVLNNVINARNIGIDIKPSKNYGMLLPSWVTYALISGNTISNCATTGIRVGPGDSYAGGVTPYNNATITNNFISNCNSAIDNDALGAVEGNIIVNNVWGISGGFPIRNNIVANNKCGITGSSIIEGNVIINNEIGIVGGTQITTNTIAKNTLGIKSGFSTLNYNNIYDNQMNVNFTSSNNADATYNWWGTTDTDKISQSIYDYKNDFTLGKVNFEPFLTSPNPDAPAIPATLPTSIPTPSPSESPSTPTPPPTSPSTPTSTPNQQPTLSPEQVTLIVGAVIVAVVVGAAAGLLIYLIKKK